MTTNNHSAMALSVALITQNATTPEKAGVLAALAVSHLVADAIPHGHYYSFAELRRTWPGAIIELGLGLVVLPLIVWYLTSTSLVWLYGCAIAASLFDFAVAAGIGIIKQLNHLVHWWEGKISTPSKWRWEEIQTLILLSVLFLFLHLYR